ncbi:GNAT family N-acetyltransferase [Fibrella aquatilis]|uniref:GNAT family N-acetyltransferase n=1 Tax=Fibrella aquatilis TaxID=2817059 RepID=A0A939GAI9_9BACT|nr:GNAT family N-acetyltransferase [Fibrella aquatilis]MBO0933689.1 GNAT family N-acetyltransferase [Fibrella aquatilis]
MTYTFRNDQPEVFLHIVREVAQWLVDGGQVLWEPGTLTADNLFDRYTRHNCYVMYAHQDDAGSTSRSPEPAGAFILQWESPIYYPDLPANTAGIIHKLAIRRSFAGQNLFQPILDFCKETCLERGIHEIQLETDATRPALMRFYERNGFTPLYQKQIHEFGQDFRCQYYAMRF